ncbi:uncharacterized protein N7458_005000 [Penicillium daleae]|uniref:Uncharacterized protein n=1 Tax=Penicillium daleae TaxID=63821 RepID=A0AAD6G4B9_9EURO|nr:uncharacterized protein N7458_005000 [Penicillium daleae]KAJ5454044.1 hypothetical protein N7458_005000 [Penicillium daleae]
MPRTRFNNNIISTEVPVSHVYLEGDETDYLGKCFTGEVKNVRLTVENQYGQTWDLLCEIAEDMNFLPNEEVVLLEDQSEQS